MIKLSVNTLSALGTKEHIESIAILNKETNSNQV
jgi:hypothetical protein